MEKENFFDYLVIDILLKIFMNLNVVELATASMVCKSWKVACCDPSLWAKIDLSRVNIFNSIPIMSYKWTIETNVINKWTNFLKYTLSFSNYNTRFLVFNYMYWSDEDFIIVAKRTPNLKRLVLPRIGNISPAGMDIAMKSWKDLESITLTCVVAYSWDIFLAMIKYCKNITEMKFTMPFYIWNAKLVIYYAPNLKILSLRKVKVELTALCSILNRLEKLEVVNVTHSLIWKSGQGSDQLIKPCDLEKFMNVSCLKKLVFCNQRGCLTCRRMFHGSRTERFEENKENIWREDEIMSLAH